MALNFRDPGYDWDDFKTTIRGRNSKRHGVALCITILVWLAIVATITLGFVIKRESAINHNADRQIALAVFSQHEDPATLAQSTMYLIDRGIASDDIISGIGYYDLMRIGNGIDVPFEPKPVYAPGTYWKVWVPLFIAALYALLSNMYFILYGCACAGISTTEPLVDLPWSKKWPIAFVAFTALPIGFPFYIASAIHIPLERKRLVRAHEFRLQVESEMAQITAQWRLASQRREEAEQSRQQTAAEKELQAQQAAASKPLPAYPMEPVSSRHFYWQLRSTARGKIIGELREKIASLIRERTEEVRQAAALLKECQDKLNESRAELRNLDDAVLSDNASDPDLVNAEFDRLLALPGVVGVMVEDDSLIVYVRAFHTYRGKTYDMGDWSVTVGVGSGVKTQILRSNLKPRWGRTKHPSYQEEDGTFCLNSRRTAINEFLQQGLFLEAISVAVATIRDVNEEDKEKLHKAFWEAA